MQIAETIIELDTSLTIIELKNTDPTEFNKTITEKGSVTIRENVFGQIRHKNYIEYLGTAWSNHYGIIISPDIIWYISLTEIASVIKKDPEKYKTIFTNNSEKIDIVIPTSDPQLIDLNLIIKELQKHVPGDISIFIPEFTTSSLASKLAFSAAFADMVSPFYNYEMFLCGIPKIKILGKEVDWLNIVSKIEQLRKLFIFDPVIKKYLDSVYSVVFNLNVAKDLDVKLWKNIFKLERCGSGSQVEVKGWITDMFIKTPRPSYIQNYPSMISRVNYVLLNTNQKFQLCQGLLSSKIENGFLIPEFGFIINELV